MARKAVDEELERRLLVLCWHRRDLAYYVVMYACTVRFPGHHLHRGDLLGVRGPLRANDIRDWRRNGDGYRSDVWGRMPSDGVLTPVLRAVVPLTLARGRLYRKSYRTESGHYVCLCPCRHKRCKRPRTYRRG